MQDIYTYLKFFHPITDEEFSAFMQESKKAHYKRNEIITAEGEVQRNMMIITEGVQYSYFLKEGKKYIIAFTYPIGLSGLPESFITQTPSKYFLEALTDTTAIEITHERVIKLFDQYQNLERLSRKMTELILIGLIHRHYELLTMTTEERFIVFANRSPHLFQLVPHKYIASYLGIDATNFSKLYNSVKV
ncbi:MAG: Crp/Fnr family transcriptional regulator [Fimbriimonadaceae bacterium]|nr:Crp/Fnr family transcriptional regulator [Chitinophagales bacterium]